MMMSKAPRNIDAPEWQGTIRQLEEQGFEEPRSNLEESWQTRTVVFHCSRCSASCSQGLFKLTGQQSCSQIVPKMPVVIQSCWSISYVYLLSYQGRYTFCTSNIWSPQKRRSGKSQDALSSAVGSGLEYGPEPVEKWQAVDRWEIDRPPGEIAMSLVNFNNRLVQPGCCLTYWQRAAKRMKGAGGMCFLFWPVLLWCFISIDVFL